MVTCRRQVARASRPAIRRRATTSRRLAPTLRSLRGAPGVPPCPWRRRPGEDAEVLRRLQEVQELRLCRGTDGRPYPRVREGRPEGDRSGGRLHPRRQLVGHLGTGDLEIPLSTTTISSAPSRYSSPVMRTPELSTGSVVALSERISGFTFSGRCEARATNSNELPRRADPA